MSYLTKMLRLFVPLLFFAVFAPNTYAENLQVVVSDAITGTSIPSLDVIAFEVHGNGDLDVSSVATTDAAGQAVMDLPGLGLDRTYRLYAVPYGAAVWSDDLVAAGSYHFEVGRLEVSLVSGADGSPMANTDLFLGARGPDGSIEWLTATTTDGSGVARLDPMPGSGEDLVLAVTSPVDGRWVFSDSLSLPTAYEFRVGNPPLTVDLVDAQSGAPVPGIVLGVFELLADGSLQPFAEYVTDAAARAVMDLPGLGLDRTYRLLAVPYGAPTWSNDLVAAGSYRFEVGRLEVSLVSGVDGSPMAHADLFLGANQPDGSIQWLLAATTDGSGMARLDPPAPGSGNDFVLAAQSPADGRWVFSESLTLPRAYEFRVGNQPLTVDLVDALSGAPLPAIALGVYELLADGSLQPSGEYVTDAAGQAIMDLPGLGAGRRYVLAADPYDTGGVRSEPIEDAETYVFRVGNVQVALVDQDLQQPLAGQRLVAAKKLPGGVLEWERFGVADANGTVKFDLADLSPSNAYLIIVEDPFGQGQTYYSDPVTAEGSLELTIARAGPSEVDLTPPMVTVVSPGDGASVAETGFAISGYAEDEAGIRSIVVNLTSPGDEPQQVQGTHDPLDDSWTAMIPAAFLTPGTSIGLEIAALDTQFNLTTKSYAVEVIGDNQPPAISVLSHTEHQQVSEKGFLVSGTVSDNTQVRRLVVTLQDSLGGTVVSDKHLDVAPDSGRWALSIRDSMVSENATVTLTFTAEDTHGNSTSRSLELLAVAHDASANQLINRITFGATPELLENVNAMGASAYLAQQLNPAGIDDSALDALLEGFDSADLTESQSYVLLHMLHSKRQLREVLTWFWENHFSTSFAKHESIQWEIDDNDGFRAEALGNFRALLDLTAKSPAMLYYLDGLASTKYGPNENYARELLELHTLGVDGGYTQADVESLARALTGWTTDSDGFLFNGAWHDDDHKDLLGFGLQGVGQEEGEQALDILAEHPSTARHICQKLAQLLVTDHPSDVLVTSCASLFQAAAFDSDQIAQIVKLLLESPEFEDQASYRTKIKTPLEFLVSLVRNFEVAQGEVTNLAYALFELDMPLFFNPSPEGYPETGMDALTTQNLITRMKLVNQIADNLLLPEGISNNLSEFFQRWGYETAEGIIGYLFYIALGNELTELEWHLAMDILSNGGATVFSLHAPDAERLLKELLLTVSSFPEYQYQ